MEMDGKVAELPAAMNNDGNLFKPLTENVYMRAVEELRREGKVSSQWGYQSLPFGF